MIEMPRSATVTSMSLTRRQLLGAGTTGLAAAGLSGLHLPAATGSTSSSSTQLTGGRFPGDPGRGFLYYGASVAWHRPLPALEHRLRRPLSVHRSYFDPDEARDLHARVEDDRRNRRLPHVSIKPPGNWADVAKGRRDRWLHRLIEPLRSSRVPVFLTIHHEPEDNAGGPGMGPRDFVAMQERAIRVARANAPNVTVIPVLQHWTFDPRRNLHPGRWVVPSTKVFGVDIYNPWSPTNGLEWRHFGDKLDEVRRWSGHRPIAVAEFGCRRDPDKPGRAARWMYNAFEYARHNNVVSLSYFNSDNSRHESWELYGGREEAFARNLRRGCVARIPS